MSPMSYRAPLRVGGDTEVLPLGQKIRRYGHFSYKDISDQEYLSQNYEITALRNRRCTKKAHLLCLRICLTQIPQL